MIGDLMTINYFSEDDSDALAHYGVIGMKWGIRRDRQGTARKVNAQVSTWKDKASQARSKAQKKDSTAFGGSKTAKKAVYEAKAAKYTRKANRSMWHPLQSPHRQAANFRKAQKYKQKAEGLSGSVAKVSKLNAKASKYEAKAERLQRAYSKELRKIERRQMRNGKAMVDKIVGA